MTDVTTTPGPGHTSPEAPVTAPDRARALPEQVVRGLEHTLAQAQRRFHAPGISAGVVRDGALVWSGQVGHARLDPAVAPQVDTEFLIGSVTKTFSAVVLMQLRDEGALALTDRLERWFPESRHAGLTVRDLLAHASGLQREPVGRIWESLEAPGEEELLRGLEEAEAVLDPHTAWHYSNLAYTLLGRVIEAETGMPWEEAVRSRVLDPLGMTHTGLVPDPVRTAHGFHVHPYTRVARREPEFDLRATAPLGGLWSSVTDMAAFLGFIADTGELLSEDTMEEMCRTVIMRDPAWTSGHGLGWMLVRHGDRIVVGHSGGMPGFVTGVKVDRSSGVGAVVFVNSTSGADPMGLAWRLIEAVLDGDPEPPQAWVPEQQEPDYADILGPWWMEGNEIVLEVRDGHLWSRFVGSTSSDARWERVGDDEWRSAEGYERGERLEVVRDDGGRPERLYLATYAVTRHPTAFGDLVR